MGLGTKWGWQERMLVSWEADFTHRAVSEVGRHFTSWHKRSTQETVQALLLGEEVGCWSLTGTRRKQQFQVTSLTMRCSHSSRSRWAGLAEDVGLAYSWAWLGYLSCLLLTPAIKVTGSPECGRKAAVADTSWALKAW